MVDVSEILAETAAPEDGHPERLDVRDLPPPQPLRDTLERLPELDPGAILVQVNDRVPQHLYPPLRDRGWEFETVETDDAVATVIWRR